MRPAPPRRALLEQIRRAAAKLRTAGVADLGGSSIAIAYGDLVVGPPDDRSELLDEIVVRWAPRWRGRKDG